MNGQEFLEHIQKLFEQNPKALKEDVQIIYDNEMNKADSTIEQYNVNVYVKNLTIEV